MTVSLPTRSVLFLSPVVALMFTVGNAQTLLSRYLLDGSATDTGTIGADGTLQGGATYVANAPGTLGSTQSLDVTGSGSRYLEANVGSSYGGLTRMTLTFWVNVQGSLTSNERFVSNLEASTFDGFDVRMGNDTSSTGFRPIFNADTVSAPATSSTTYNGDDQWVFIGITYDTTLGSNQVEFFKGFESSSVISGGTDSHNSVGALNTSSLLRIGATPATNNDRTPPVFLSDVRVYDGILSQTQLEEVRMGQVIPEPSTLAVLLVGGFGLAHVIRRHLR